MAASEKGETCMDDFDVKNHDQEIDDLLSEVKGLLSRKSKQPPHRRSRSSRKRIAGIRSMRRKRRRNRARP